LASKTTPPPPPHVRAAAFSPPILEPPLAPAELLGRRLAVCVTGATGFVAGHVVHRLLAAGHTVRATCRAPENAESVAHLWQLPGARERLTLFKADLLAPAGEFDEAVRGCDVVVHTASPYVVQDYKPGEEDARIVRPAIRGTESVLASVEKAAAGGGAGARVRRVVLTASTASVFTDPVEDPAKEFAAVAKPWQPQEGEVEVEEDGAAASDAAATANKKAPRRPPIASEKHWNFAADKTAVPYFYAKTMAEARAYELEAQQRQPGRWTLCSINPPAILGPPLSSRADGESVSQMRDMLSGRIWPCTPYIGCGVADVRDVAQAHCLAAVLPEARGRYLVASHREGYALHDAAKVLRALYPRRLVPFIGAWRWLAMPFCPMLGLPTAMARAMYAKPARISTLRAAKGLGKGASPAGGEAPLPEPLLPYLPFEKTVADMAEAMIARGMVPREAPVLVVFTIKLVAALVVLALVLWRVAAAWAFGGAAR
jgi:nucleoside-diphosphate-sugar epimerase